MFNVYGKLSPTASASGLWITTQSNFHESEVSGYSYNTASLS